MGIEEKSGIFWWSKETKRPSEEFEWSGDIVDFNLPEGELLTGLTTMNGKLYAFTNKRAFVVQKKVTHKSKIRIWVERIWRRARK